MKVSGQLHAPAALPPGKSAGTHYFGGWLAPKPVRTFRRREKGLAAVGIRALDRPACSAVAILNTLQCKTMQYENLHMRVWIFLWLAVSKQDFFFVKKQRLFR